MQDGKGALYFVNGRAFGENNETLPGKPRLFFRPQATPKTRQQMREDSPSGVVQMDSMLGRTFTYRFLAAAAIVAVSALAAINMMLPPTW